MKELYFIFAPPRVGNHWVEMMLGGLYFIAPVFIFDENGHIRKDLGEVYGTNDVLEILNNHARTYIPKVSPDSPELFFEHKQPLSNEFLSRGKEVDLDIIRSLIGSHEIGRPTDPLAVEWFHGGYHVKPFVPKLPLDVEARFWFIKRAPQAAAFSLFKIATKWSVETKHKSFLDYYTTDFLDEIFFFYGSYSEILKSHKGIILKYEDMICNCLPLESLVTECVGQQSKLSPLFVWKNTAFDNITKQDVNREFYRIGKVDAWLSQLNNEELRKVVSIENDYDFSSIGYPRTKEMIEKKHNKSWWKKILRS